MAERPDTSSISAALGDATPGPWWHQVTTACFDVIEGGDRTSDSHYIAMMGTDYDGHDTQDAPNVRADAHLIANAPTWLAQLLDALEAARADAGYLQDKWDAENARAIHAESSLEAVQRENERLTDALRRVAALGMNPLHPGATYEIAAAALAPNPQKEDPDA